MGLTWNGPSVGAGVSSWIACLLLEERFLGQAVRSIDETGLVLCSVMREESGERERERGQTKVLMVISARAKEDEWEVVRGFHVLWDLAIPTRSAWELQLRR